MSNTRTANGTHPGGVRKTAKVKVESTLDLDKLRAEYTPLEPFTVILGGRSVEFADPHDLDWQEVIAALSDPRMLLRMALSEDDGTYLLDEAMSLREINTVVETWLRFYDFNVEALGKPIGSRTS